MKIVVITLLLFLVGCASIPYGNYTAHEKTYTVISNDVLVQINSLYPPAHTTFSLMHEINQNDVFGNSLIEKMRKQGYAIQIFSKDNDAKGIPFGYSLDKIDDIFRFMGYVNNQRLSRPYLIENGSVVTMGAWSLKE